MLFGAFWGFPWQRSFYPLHKHYFISSFFSLWTFVAVALRVKTGPFFDCPAIKLEFLQGR